MDKNLQYTLSLKDLFKNTMRGAVAETGKLDSKMSSLDSTVGRVGVAIAGAFSVSQIVSFGKSVVDAYTNFEYFHASLKTMLQGNENAATALETRLIDLAKTTPFQLTEVQQATKQLLAYGFKAGDVVQTMRTLGDVSAGVGAPLGDIAYLYGTLKTSGRVMLTDLRQFAGRGIPIYESLSKSMGVTKDQLNGMVHDGKIGFKDIEKAFGLMTKEGGQFFNLMNDQSKTLGGKISNLGDAWDQFKVNLGTTASEGMKNSLSFISSFLDEVNMRLATFNRLTGSLNKAGQGLSFWEREFGGGGKSKQLDFQNKLEAMRGDKSLTDDQKISRLNEVAKQITIQNQTNRVLGRNNDNLEYLRSIEQIKSELGFYKGEKSLNSMKELETGSDSIGGKSGGKSSALGTGTEVTGNRPQALYITINDGLVKVMNINTTNVTEGSAQIKEMVGKALIETVNDVNQMER
jgi:tape measure domain-containing protein